MKKLNSDKIYRASIYLRLSKEDGDKIESDSIGNQRDLINNFLLDKADIQVVSERVDDGYSGATFDRPSLKQMLADVEYGVIDCIIVKDLSRFGRNFVEVGRYVDQVFPRLGVRLISINDNFDNVNGRTSSDNVLLPFLNLINDAFCRDISIKVRSQLEVKRKKGDFIGSFAVYGYLKDPLDRHKLVIDDYAANVVRDIFKWKIGGQSQQRIANKLNEMGILSPMEYKRFCGMDYRTGFGVNSQGKWSAVAVGRILKDECYIGTLVQGKRTTPNHKVKKVIYKASEEWVRVENSHEPIITCEDFETVNHLLKQDTRVAPKRETVYTFSGLLFCGDCKQGMVRNSSCKNGKTYYAYICGMNRTKKKCSSHRISEPYINEGVLLALKQHIANIVQVDKVLTYLETLPYQQKEVQKFDKQIIAKQEEIERYNRLKTSLYESMVDGILVKAEYLEMKTVYDRKKQDAKAALLKLKDETEKLLQNHTEENEWIEKFKIYQNIDSIDRRIAVNLIDKIYVYEDKRIEIVFKYQYSYNQAVAFIQNAGKVYSLTTSEQEKEVV